jgi:hypothetical protein
MLHKVKFIIPSPVPSAFYQITLLVELPESFGGRIIFSVDIIPPWFSMLIHQLGVEKQARWWPQFRDVVSPHRHEKQLLFP